MTPRPVPCWQIRLADGALIFGDRGSFNGAGGWALLPVNGFEPDYSTNPNREALYGFWAAHRPAGWSFDELLAAIADAVRVANGAAS